MEAALQAMQAAGIKTPPHLQKGKSVFNKDRDANKAMINIQQAVRNNATDVQNYVNDMDDFFNEMKIKDKNPEKRLNSNVSI